MEWAHIAVKSTLLVNQMCSLEPMSSLAWVGLGISWGPDSAGSAPWAARLGRWLSRRSSPRRNRMPHPSATSAARRSCQRRPRQPGAPPAVDRAGPGEHRRTPAKLPDSTDGPWVVNPPPCPPARMKSNHRSRIRLWLARPTYSPLLSRGASRRVRPPPLRLRLLPPPNRRMSSPQLGRARY
jgi:hypothetical protein